MRLIFFISLIFYFIPNLLYSQSWYNSSWLYRKVITIDYTKVGTGPHTNFPVLISRADADLQTDAQTDGDDILFTSSDGTTKLDHQIESYTSASGTIVVWVEVPTLLSSANTILYMYYGNAAATSQQNATGTWDSNFRGVYHLNGAFTDATSNAYNGTNTGTFAATGMISGGRGYLRSDGDDKITITGKMGNPVNVTMSAWINLTSLDGTGGAEVVSIGDLVALRINDEAAVNKFYNFYYDGTGYRETRALYGVTGWHYVAYTINDAGNAQIDYLDGVQVTPTTAFTGSISYVGGGANTIIGSHGNTATDYAFEGTIDEVRIASTIRSAGWLLTEYNNQSSPATFYAVSSEVSVKTWDGGAGTSNWGDANNWNPNGVPTTLNFVNLTGANTININVAAVASGIALSNASLILTIQTSTSLTVSGNMSMSAGTLNTLASFPTVSGTTTLSGGTVGYTMASGTQVVAANTYYNLSLSGGGTKTMPASAMTVTNNFTMSGTVSATAGQALAVGGFTIGAGCTFNAASYTHTLTGNFANNGTFTSSTSTMSFNGSAAQTISGGSLIFKNLTVNNSSGVSLSNTSTLNGNLTLTLGAFTTNNNLSIDFTNGGAIAGSGGGTTSGNITVKRTISQIGWHLIGSPLAGRTYADINDNVPINSSVYNFYTYKESDISTDLLIGWTKRTEALTTALSGSKDGTGSPSAMVGYDLYMSAAATIDFTGTYTHSASYTTGALSYTSSSASAADGWQLLSNPYPSYISWDLITAGNKVNLDAGITYYNATTGAQAVYLPANGTSQADLNGGSPFIPPMQAFWVKTNATNASLSVSNTARVTSPNLVPYNAPSFYRVASGPELFVKLKVASSACSDETIVRFHSATTDAYEGQSDCIKLKNDNNCPSLYTVIGGNEYAINSLTDQDISERIIPLALDATQQDEYTIDITKSNIESYLVFLKDKKEGIIHKLNNNPYRFVVNANDNADRFNLMFKTNLITIADEGNLKDEVIIDNQNSKIKISFGSINERPSVTISNLIGQEIFSMQKVLVNNGISEIELEDNQSGIFLVSIHYDGKFIQKKIFLNK